MFSLFSRINTSHIGISFISILEFVTGVLEYLQFWGNVLI